MATPHTCLGFIVLIGLCCLCCAPKGFLHGSAAALDSPLEHQVFERQTLDRGEILIKGRAWVDADRVEARLAASTKWWRISYDRTSRTFNGGLPAPAGGFYQVAVRLSKGAKTLGELAVARVGVGEVFVIAGQSNATNYGEVRQETKSGMVVAFDGHSWQIANDPQPGVQDNSRKGSFIPSFGDALYAKYRVPIGVADVGHGSTSVRQWLPQGETFSLPPTMSKFVKEAQSGIWECDGTLFNGMMSRVQQLGPHGFRALLWHQGESDANQKAGHQLSGSEYRRMLVDVIKQSHKKAGWDFPWFVAEASYHNPADPGSPEIREAQQSLWKAGIALEGPDTDQLTGHYRQDNGAGVHFSAEGLHVHGELWAHKVEIYLASLLAGGG